MPDDILEINLREVLGSAEAPSTQQLTLYIPNKDRKGREIKNLHIWIKEAQKVLTIIGGGSTTMPPAEGTWLSRERDIDSIDHLKDEDMLWEKTTIIYTYIYPDRFEKNLNCSENFCIDLAGKRIKEKWYLSLPANFSRFANTIQNKGGGKWQE